MNAALHGFDLGYEIDHDTLLGALENLLADPVAMRLQVLDLYLPLPQPAAPLHTVQHGTFRFPSQPSSSLTLPTAGDPSTATFTIHYPATSLQLDAVTTTALGLNIGALPPTAAGPMDIGFTLSFAGSVAGLRGAITISSPAPTVSITIPDSTTTLLGALGPATIPLASLAKTAVTSSVQDALASLLPLALDVPLDPPDDCGIGVRALGVKLLSAASGTKPALGFFLQLLGDSHPDLSAVTMSDVPSATNVAFAISNTFLQKFLCCLFRRSPDIQNLPEPQPPKDPDDGCCHWRDVSNVTLGAQRVTLDELDICIQQAGAQAVIHLHTKASQSGTGWSAWASFDCDFSLGNSGGVLAVAQINVTTDQGHHCSAWVWILVGVGAILGAIVGALIGLAAGPGGVVAGLWEGGVVGAGVGAALVGVVYAIEWAIGSTVSNTISGVLGLFGLGNRKVLPDGITKNFGTLDSIVTIDFDDLFVAGRGKPPGRDNVVREGADVVLRLGDRVDLDRGLVQRAGESQPGFDLEGDLEWQPDQLPASTMFRAARVGPGDAVAFLVGSIQPLATARLLPLGDSFWSLTESALLPIHFSDTRTGIAHAAIPSSETPYPAGARVFAVRTTAGRLAKCVAWRDSSEALHLSYVTYNTAVPLAISAQWTATLGPMVASPSAIFGLYEVARVGAFSARTAFPYFGPVPFHWRWNGAPITGSGTLPDGTTQYTVSADHLRLASQMGKPIRGVLQLELTVTGNRFVATLDLDEPGTQRHVNAGALALQSPQVPPRPEGVEPASVPPFHEQLPAAFARGMGIPLDRVKFQ